MSQAAQPILAGPTQPAPRRRFPLAVFALVVVVVLAIPGGAFAYAGNELSQGRSLESQGKFAQVEAQLAELPDSHRMAPC